MQSDYSLHFSLEQNSPQRTISVKQVSSSNLFEHDNQNNSDHLECMVEKISKLDDEFSTTMEGIKNSTNLFVKGESIVQLTKQYACTRKRFLILKRIKL